MKKQLTLFFMLCCFAAFTQESDDSYIMFESVILEPDNEHIVKLAENLAHHNKMYHKEGPFQASVFHITTGPNIGKMVWMMGPLTYTDLDSRPSGDGHDEDWATNVVPYLEGVSHGEYWKRDASLSLPRGDKSYANFMIRYHDIAKGLGDRYDKMMEKTSAAIKTMDLESWAVYDNEFRQGYITGRHVAVTWGFDKWATFDEKLDPNFKDAYIALYGEDSWGPFLEEWNAVITNSYDEVWSYDAELSGQGGNDSEDK